MDTRLISYQQLSLDDLISYMNEKNQAEKEAEWKKQNPRADMNAMAYMAQNMHPEIGNLPTKQQAEDVSIYDIIDGGSGQSFIPSAIASLYGANKKVSGFVHDYLKDNALFGLFSDKEKPQLSPEQMQEELAMRALDAITPIPTGAIAGMVGDTVYHGTNEAFDQFGKEHFGKATRATSAKQGTWLVSDAETANGYAHYSARNAPVEKLVAEADAAGNRGNWDLYDEIITKAEKLQADIDENMWRGQNIRPVKYDGDYHTVDMDGAEFTDKQNEINRIIAKAKRDGKSGVIFKNLADDVGFNNRPAEHTVVFDPKNIKSVFDK